MRYFYLLAFVFLFFSCSSSNDSDIMNIEEDKEMKDMMLDNVAYSGDFISSAHPTSGKVTINDDLTKLIFTDFSTDDGPLLEVYLATDSSASTYISLGELKGTNGDYEYALPENTDYSTYNHVIIWCVTFSVNFGYAVLE